MSDPYYLPHQTYTPLQDNPVYLPPENQDQYQASAYGYEPHSAHNSQLEAYQTAYIQQQYELSAQDEEHVPTPTIYHPVPEPQNGYLSPASTMANAYTHTHGHDDTRLRPHYEPRPQGSNAEYYNPSLHEGDHHQTAREFPSNVNRGENEINADGRERGIGGALVGGGMGYYLGHKKSHGLLGAVGGALFGNFLENKLGARREDGHGHHGHGHQHGHGRRRTRHHHHHGSHSRSRSRHSRRSSSSFSG